MFCLVNDAIQIHRAYRSDDDKVVIVAIHVPHTLLENKKIKLIANTAIDLNYDHSKTDFVIEDFGKDGDYYKIDFEALRARGIDLHEMYSKNLPFSIKEAEKIGIEQEFFIAISENSAIKTLGSRLYNS